MHDQSQINEKKKALLPVVCPVQEGLNISHGQVAQLEAGQQLLPLGSRQQGTHTCNLQP